MTGKFDQNNGLGNNNHTKDEMCHHEHFKYRQNSNIRRILLGNKLADHADVVGASPDGAAPTISSFTT